MTAPTTSATPKITLDQRASSRHDIAGRRSPPSSGMRGSLQPRSASTLGCVEGGASDGNFTAPFVPTLDDLGVEGQGGSHRSGCILVDDIVNSGGTLCNAADALIAEGAKGVLGLYHPWRAIGRGRRPRREIEAARAGHQGYHRTDARTRKAPRIFAPCRLR